MMSLRVPAVALVASSALFLPTSSPAAARLGVAPVSPSANATCPQDPVVIDVEYKDGRTSRVQVLGLEGQKVRLKTFVMGGSMDIVRSLSDFKPASAFRIEVEAAQPKTYEDHFRLAMRAGELRLIPLAGVQARAAVKAAGSDTAKVNAVRAWAADALEAALKDAIAAGDLKSAKHFLELLSTRLADQRTEEQLAVHATAVEGLELAVREKKTADRQAKLDEKTRSEIERRLKPIRAEIEKGDKLQMEALAKSRNTSQSRRLSERAVESYKSAWKSTQALQKKHPEDASLATEVETIGSRVHESAIDAALHAANMLTVQSDYKGAMEWCNRVLAFDPDNGEAKEMVRTIQIAAAAASSEWGWGWGRAGQIARPR